MKQGAIYFGTVLLEANRWAAVRAPTYRVSEWMARMAAAGFDGLELWENHAVQADAAERAALQDAPLPVAIFNSYAPLDAGGESARQEVAERVRALKAGAIKFNVGPAMETLESELGTVRAWGAHMPGVDLLCECHPGTALEDPAVAEQVLAGYPEIGVIVHPFSGSDLGAWFQHLGSRIRHAHVQVVDAQWQRWRLRDQADLVQERLAIMRRGGYSGTYTIEFTAGVGVAPEDREALFAAACDDLVFLGSRCFGL